MIKVITKKRHRGIYNSEHESPYELSRTRIENFIKCPACFFLEQVKGIKFPSTPGFNINEATDVLLKKDFARFRDSQQSHPFLIELGLDYLVPFKHEDFELWTQSLHFGAKGRLNTVHEPSNLKIGGGLDDVWLNLKTNKLHIVDYKSTSLKSPDKKLSLEEPWKMAYKRQMDLYVWILRQKDFEVDDIGYFLYCNADRFSGLDFLQKEDARMNFKVSLIEYNVNTSWVEPVLLDIKKLLDSQTQPTHSRRCEYGQLFENINKLGG